MQWLDRLGKLDRRWIFLFIGLSVFIPVWLGMRAEMPTTPIVQRLYDAVSDLEAGDRVLISFDFGPGTVPENQPMADALVRHCMEKGIRVIMMTLWATGPPQIDDTIESVFLGELATHPDKRYGVDWINLGYKVGNQGVINSLVTDFGFFTADIREGRPLSEFAITRDLTRLGDLDFILGIGSGKPGLKEWVQFGGDQANVPVGGGVTAVEAPLLYPYYPSQLVGLMGGLQGAAEYETALLGEYGRLADFDRDQVSAATAKMGPQTIAHIVILLFVLIGNISMIAAKRRERRHG